jgi:hypothetical protein
MPPKGKVIHHDDDGDEDDEQLFHMVRAESKGSKKGQSRPASRVNSTAGHQLSKTNTNTSSSTSSSQQNIAGEPSNVTIIALDDDEDETSNVQTSSKLAASLAGKRNRDAVDLDAAYESIDADANLDDLKNDPTYQSLLSLRQQSKTLKTTAYSSSSSSASAGLVAKLSTEDAEPVDKQTPIFIRKILSAEERRKLVEEGYKQQLLQQQSKKPRVEATALPDGDETEEEDESGETITIKARLVGGNHERQWKVAPSAPFEKVCSLCVKVCCIDLTQGMAYAFLCS